MNYYYKVLVLLLGTLSLYADDYKRPMTALESGMIGATVAAAEVALPGQLLSYWMNQRIKKQPFVWADSYKGFGAHLSGIMPIMAAQRMVQSKGTQLLERSQEQVLSLSQKMGVSYVAGIAGAIIDTPLNAVQLYLQDKVGRGKSYWDAIRYLGRQSYRGFVPNALLKEGPFVVGYQALAPMSAKMMRSYTDNELLANVLGGTTAGVVTAFATQSGAVVRNKMQADIIASHSVKKGMWGTAVDIVRKDGIKGLYAGLPQRSLRIVIAIPLYTLYTDVLEHVMRR